MRRRRACLRETRPIREKKARNKSGRAPEYLVKRPNILLHCKINCCAAKISQLLFLCGVSYAAALLGRFLPTTCREAQPRGFFYFVAVHWLVMSQEVYSAAWAGRKK